MPLPAPRPETALLTPAEVAHAFRVDSKTVVRWAKAGKLTSFRTLGGHRRYRRDEVEALLAADEPREQRPNPFARAQNQAVS